jgi:hypothetical protein
MKSVNCASIVVMVLLSVGLLSSKVHPDVTQEVVNNSECTHICPNYGQIKIPLVVTQVQESPVNSEDWCNRINQHHVICPNYGQAELTQALKDQVSLFVWSANN